MEEVEGPLSRMEEAGGTGGTLKGIQVDPRERLSSSNGEA